MGFPKRLSQHTKMESSVRVLPPVGLLMKPPVMAIMSCFFCDQNGLSLFLQAPFCLTHQGRCLLERYFVTLSFFQ